MGTIISNELSQLPYVEIRCRYDLTTAVQVCDCEHRDEVTSKMFFFLYLIVFILSQMEIIILLFIKSHLPYRS